MQGELYRQREALRVRQEREQVQPLERELGPALQRLEPVPMQLAPSRATRQAPPGEDARSVTQERLAPTRKAQRRQVRREQEAAQRARRERQAQREALEQLELSTLEHSVLPGITMEQARANGVVSYRHDLPEEHAETVVKAANGFLYAKPNGDGTAQLKATLPEKAELNVGYRMDGTPVTAQVDFRKNYNLFQKLLVRTMLDETGAPTLDRFTEISNCFMDITQLEKQDLRGRFSQLVEGEVVSSELSKLGYRGRSLARAKEDLLNFMVGTCYEKKGICVSALGNIQSMGSGMAGTLSRLTLARDHPLSDRVDARIRALEAQGLPDSAIEEEVNAMISCYTDCELARLELMELRELDIDSPDVALVNVCSDNSDMLSGFAKVLKRPSDTCRELEYQLGEDNLLSDIPRAVAWAESQPQSFWETARFSRERLLELASALSIQSEPQRTQAAQRLFPGTRDEPVVACRNEFKMFFLSHGIYSVHRAMQVGLLDGSPITLETYAATDDQYAATPITRRIGVGIYRGGPRGFQNFYNQKSWLLDRKQQKKAAMKYSL